MNNRQRVVMLRCICMLVLVNVLSLQCLAGSTTEISYQGFLENSLGNPVTGFYNMQFSIFNAESGGSHIWPVSIYGEIHSMVEVTNGVFSVFLGSQGNPITSDIFSGADRYLQIQVCATPGSGCISFETLTPRQKLTGAGYAQKSVGFVPGLTMTFTGNLLTLTSTGSSGAAIAGFASNSTGTGAGVYGEADGTNSAGIAGYNTSDGFGVYGSSTSGYGVYSNGDTHINGELTWLEKTGYVALHSIAFSEVPNSCIVQTYTSVRACDTAPLAPCAWASIDLPHGATMTEMKVHWTDSSSTNNGQAVLYHSIGDDNYHQIASCQSTGDSGTVSTTSTTDFGFYADIDNENRSYFVLLTLPSTGASDFILFRKLFIEYTVTSPH